MVWATCTNTGVKLDNFLAQCGGLISMEYPLVISVLLAGLVGSASHCSLMCSPLVAAQMLQLRESNTRPNSIGFYHAGRITTYMLLGAVAVMASQWIFGGALTPFTQLAIIIAGVTFIISAFQPRKTHHCCDTKTQKLGDVINRVPVLSLQLYLRGILMGFMPCGLILSALMLAATLQNPLLGMGVMALFGLATLPVLHIMGMSVLSLSGSHPLFASRLSRAAMAFNGLILCGIGFNLVSVS